jgi:hypothetical protein
VFQSIEQKFIQLQQGDKRKMGRKPNKQGEGKNFNQIQQNHLIGSKRVHKVPQLKKAEI